MKRNIVFFVILICLFWGCDKIEKPYMHLNDTKVEPLSVAKFDSIAGTFNASGVYRKFLFEEFTGSHCTNCPDGHQTLRDLKTVFGDTMIIVGIHAGSLAEPNYEYPYEFRVSEGLQLYTDFGASYVPFGVLNRTRYNGNSVIIPPTSGKWKSTIQQRDKSAPCAAVQIVNQYDNQRQMLVSNAKVTMLQDYPNPLYIAFYIIEDKIIKPQLNHGVRIPDYEHSHVLRGSMNGVYGKPLNGTGILAKDSVCLMACKISFYEKDWAKENCQIVAFIRDNTTGEILQVEEKDIQN
ncbi:MAG: Omp28 family outer membrane lipoprotein [Bacteroidales bacterium]|jgi:hypothetical protein|nr:Omp28 family outer membrane lipoprotein [Bacteroidales bacterium]